MPKPNKKPKSRLQQNTPLLHKSWFVILIVGLIAITGILIIQFSHADSNASLAQVIQQEYDKLRAAHNQPAPPTPHAVLVSAFEQCSATGDFPNIAKLKSGSQGACVVYLRRFMDIVMEKNVASATQPASDMFDDNGGNALSLKDRVQTFQQAIVDNLNSANWSGDNAAAKQKLLSDNRMSQDASGHLSIPITGTMDPQTWFWLNVIAYVYLAGN